MIDLEKVSGLPIAINDDYTIKFNQPLDEVRPTVRTFEQMKSVMMEPDAKPFAQEMYYMYRNVHFKEDEKALAEVGVTYDITVIPPGKIGEEFNKTVGHYHATKPGTKIAYPEAYEVLNGHALFLLQKMDPLFEDIITVIAMEARAGDKVVYPPNYGHIIVNLGSDVLVTSNWVGDNFERMYAQVSDRQGMAYYVVADPEKRYKFVPNSHYGKLPEVRMLTNQFMNNFAIMGNGPMYTLGTGDPKSLEFLNHPDKYAVELSSITS
jgi:glucose-6-phosphate isomerase, archaeal